MHLDDFQTQLLAAAKGLVQVGGRFDAAPQDCLGRRSGRVRIAQRRRKRRAQVSAHTDLVALARLSAMR